MIDIHCHIIPEIDDGSRDILCSIDMAKMAYEDGVKKIIATPHFYANHYENSFFSIEEKLHMLNSELKNNEINLEILPGQEIFLDNHLLNLYKKGIINTLNKNNKYMLLETDFTTFPKEHMDLIYEMRIKGIRTIIAHPERYLYVQKDIESLNPFIEEGCLFQLNAGSIMGVYGKEVKKTSKLLIEKGLCDFVASDAHGVGKRNPKLRECYDFIENNYEYIYDDILENAGAVVNGFEIEKRHEVVKVRRRGFFGIFK
ncbi:tyrosine-protein phosphatase [Haloimpatiens lingqiaonensis]|uniref:tyrosine-protein phosphatase n=1 Tax=Haloimpatiens lingqiaonensis TaxID=1380675 RepID=UPI0010FE0B11|nr:CpsB/CapC family capsule biosynthesis tyrosine phosphatase [Haloimpatiens lingqiaonensis]